MYNSGRDTGGAGGLSPPPTFKLGGHGPPTLQRRQLYTWVGDSQYSVKNVALCGLSIAAAISIYTTFFFKEINIV